MRMAFRMISPAFSVTGAFTENRLSSPCRSPFALKITSSPVPATRTTALPFSFVRPIFFAFAIARDDFLACLACWPVWHTVVHVRHTHIRLRCQYLVGIVAHRELHAVTHLFSRFARREFHPSRIISVRVPRFSEMLQNIVRQYALMSAVDNAQKVSYTYFGSLDRVNSLGLRVRLAAIFCLPLTA